MEAFEMVLVIMLALVIGVVLTGLIYYKNETNEWKKQVDDERSRYDG